MSNQPPQEVFPTAVSKLSIVPGFLARNFYHVHIRLFEKSLQGWDIASFAVLHYNQILKPDRIPRYTPGISLTYELPPEGITAFIQFTTIMEGRNFVIGFGTTPAGEHWCTMTSVPGQHIVERDRCFASYLAAECDPRDQKYPMNGAVVLQPREPSKSWDISIDTIEIPRSDKYPEKRWRVAAAITVPSGFAYGFNCGNDPGPRAPQNNRDKEWFGVFGYVTPYSYTP